VLYPETQALVLTPVAPHLSAGTPLVLPASAIVEMRVEAEHPAILSVDGQEEIEMVSGAGVRVSASPHVARFLRLGPPSSFYASLARRLGWIREDGSMPPESDPPQKPA
jgi:NAD+ kinase